MTWPPAPRVGIGRIDFVLTYTGGVEGLPMLDDRRAPLVSVAELPTRNRRRGGGEVILEPRRDLMHRSHPNHPATLRDPRLE